MCPSTRTVGALPRLVACRSIANHGEIAVLFLILSSLPLLAPASAFYFPGVAPRDFVKLIPPRSPRMAVDPLGFRGTRLLVSISKSSHACFSV